MNVFFVSNANYPQDTTISVSEGFRKPLNILILAKRASRSERKTNDQDLALDF